MAVNFVAKAPAMFLRFSQPRLATFVKYAKVELTPPSPGELGQVVKGAAGLVGDAITFKWATTTIGQAAVNAVVVTEVRERVDGHRFVINIILYNFSDCLLVLHW